MRLERHSENEKEVLIELLKEIEMLALKYELKHPKNVMIGGL